MAQEVHRRKIVHKGGGAREWQGKRAIKEREGNNEKQEKKKKQEKTDRVSGLRTRLLTSANLCNGDDHQGQAGWQEDFQLGFQLTAALRVEVFVHVGVLGFVYKK